MLIWTILKNAILIGDRFYFTYKLLNYLNDNNLKFVIRVKGKGKNLKDFTNFRIVSCTNSHDKTFIILKQNHKYSHNNR